MGILAIFSGAFVSMCSTVAMVVTTVTDWVGFILHVNYTVVTTIYTTVCDILSVIFAVLNYVLQTAVVILVYIADFLYEIYGCVCALLVLVWRVLVLFYKIFCILLTGVETLALGVWNGGVITFKTLHQSAANIVETCETTTDYLAMLAQDFVAYVCNVFTTVGNFSADFVRGVWVGIGYVPAAIAFLPVYVAQWINKLWMRCTMWTTYAFTGVTRETYLGVIVICILYLLVSRILCVMNAHGMTLFSSRRRTSHAGRQTANRGAFGVDRGFESDGNDEDDDDDDDNTNNDDASDDDDLDDNGSETQTELTLSDNDDSDGHSVGSESDVSLNSQTFSSEESDHEIDVQLPPEAEHYSLRSRSSTPSRHAQKDLTHEQYEQELERERDKRKCVVCQDVNKSVLILPCKHMCLCVICANQIVRSHFLERRVCPLCRSRIEKVINVYV